MEPKKKPHLHLVRTHEDCAMPKDTPSEQAPIKSEIGKALNKYADDLDRMIENIMNS